MTYTRQCANWIQSFREWTVDRSQMRIELIDWSAIFTIACVLKRKVAITQEYLGSWTCYPFLYVIVVGPSGIGKTTAIRYSFNLTDQIPVLAKPTNLASIEGIVDDLVNAKDNSVYFTVEELEDIFIKDYSRRMFGFLTSLYDGKVSLRQKTVKRDLEFADKPCLNLFAGTTPEWVADNIPPGVLNGGFGSRVLWVHIPSLRRRKMYYHKEMKAKNYPQLEKNLIADLNHIATSIEGEYKITNEALDYVEEWNSTIPDKIKFKGAAGYIQRKAVFVHKLAMIHHAAYSDVMELNLHDFHTAITMVESLEGGLPSIFSGIGKNEYVLEMREIAKFVVENPGITDKKVRQHFETAAPPSRLHELIEGLLVSGVIYSKLNDDNERIFYFQED